MTQQEAINVASAARGTFGVPTHYQPAPAEKRIIEIVAGTGPTDGHPDRGPTVDRIAWLVRFMDGPWWIELAVDDSSSQILRVRHARSAVLQRGLTSA